MGLLARAVKVAQNELDDPLARARAWGMSPTYHGRAPGALQGDHLRPSRTGIIGPGIYTHDVRAGAQSYGDEVEELMVTDNLAPVWMLDQAVARLRKAGVRGDEVTSRAVEELQAKGFEGVRDGSVRAVWSPRDVRRTTARFMDRDSTSLMAGMGGLALGGGLLARAGQRPSA